MKQLYCHLTKFEVLRVLPDLLGYDAVLIFIKASAFCKSLLPYSSGSLKTTIQELFGLPCRWR